MFKCDRWRRLMITSLKTIRPHRNHPIISVSMLHRDKLDQCPIFLPQILSLHPVPLQCILLLIATQVSISFAHLHPSRAKSFRWYIKIYLYFLSFCNTAKTQVVQILRPLIITVTSQWVQWRLKSSASRLFTQPFIQAQIKESIKAPRHWPLWGEFTGDRLIPRTKGQ